MKKHEFGLFWWWLEPPKRVTIWAPGKGDLGKRAQTFFYLKLDIKNKLFTDAILSRTKKKHDLYLLKVIVRKPNASIFSY